MQATAKNKAFARIYSSNGFNATEAMARIIPSTSRGYLAVAGHRMINNDKTQEALAHELAEIMSPDEVKQRISEIARSGQSEANKLKGLELMARVHALLTDRNINENIDLSPDALSRAAEEAIQSLSKPVKGSEQAELNKPTSEIEQK